MAIIVIDNVTNVSPDAALSANQGYILNNKITDLNATVDSISTLTSQHTLDIGELQVQTGILNIELDKINIIIG